MPTARAPATVTVRRAVLPWRRVVRPSRFDFTPGGGFGNLAGDELGLLLAVVLVPLWLPAALMCVPALAELVLDLVLLPVAVVRRRRRRAWPVQVLQGSRVLRTETFETFAVAGRRAESLRGWLLVHPGDATPSRSAGGAAEGGEVSLPPPL